jgi:hypothetical protein
MKYGRELGGNEGAEGVEVLNTANQARQQPALEKGIRKEEMRGELK